MCARWAAVCGICRPLCRTDRNIVIRVVCTMRTPLSKLHFRNASFCHVQTTICLSHPSHASPLDLTSLHLMSPFHHLRENPICLKCAFCLKCGKIPAQSLLLFSLETKCGDIGRCANFTQNTWLFPARIHLIFVLAFQQSTDPRKNANLNPNYSVRGKLQSRRCKLNKEINKELRLRAGAENLYKVSS